MDKIEPRMRELAILVKRRGRKITRQQATEIQNFFVKLIKIVDDIKE